MVLLTHASYYRGASHLDSGAPVEDRATVRSVGYSDGLTATVLALADGHGGSEHFRSHIGAQMAIDAVCDALPPILAALSSLMPHNTVSRGVAESAIATDSDCTPRDTACEDIFRTFFADINNRWASKVMEHWRTTPPDRGNHTTSPARAYGCTLLAAVRTDSFWLALQLGDGACVALDASGNILDLIPGDSRCVLSSTTSMCSCTPADFRYAYGRDIPPAMMLCSDGLADCFDGNNDLGLRVLLQIATDTVSEGFAAVEADIADSLPKISSATTRDDTAIALWLDSDALSDIAAAAGRVKSDVYRSKIDLANVELEDCADAIGTIEAFLDCDEACDDEIKRKMSVLSSLRRRQYELMHYIEDLNADLEDE